MTKKERNEIYATADYVGLSEAERVVFRSVVKTMQDLGLFEPSDAPLVASYARSVVLARKAAECIEEKGVLLEEEDKYKGKKTKENPAVNILQKAQNAMESIGAKLGLSPTGRKRLKGEGKPKKTELELFNEQFQ